MALGSNLKGKKDSLFPKKKKDMPKAQSKAKPAPKETPVKEKVEEVVIEQVTEVSEPELRETILDLKKMYTITIQPSKRKKVKKTKVIMEGDLTILEMQSIKDELVPLFDVYDFVDIVLNNVGKLDLSCVQMLYAMKSHYASIGKTVTVDSELPAELKTIINRAGFSDVLCRTLNS